MHSPCRSVGSPLRFAFVSLALLAGAGGCSDTPNRSAATPPPAFSGSPATETSSAPPNPPAPAANSGPPATPAAVGAPATPAAVGAPATPAAQGAPPSPAAVGAEMVRSVPLQPSPASPPSAGTPGAAGATGSSEPPVATLRRVLVFTRTLGFRHASIGAGVAALQKLGMENGFRVDPSEDATRFNDATLADYDVVVWLSTSADVLDDAQQSAFQRYIQAGGGWVGVHAASDTEYDWPWFGQLLGNGAWFKVHPAIQTARLVVEQRDHASTAHLPASFSLEDEWYNFYANPRSSVNVLLRLDETSYTAGAGAMGDHPIAWYHEFDGGRVWYTALGHRNELYQDPQFTQHLLGGLRWAAGTAPK